MWGKHSSGLYTVKTGYQLAYGILYGDERGSDVTAGAPASLWNWLWGTQLPQKTKMLGWKCGKGILPVLVSLASRIPNTDTQCKICHNETESILMHALFTCSWAQKVWQDSQLVIGKEMRTSTNMVDFLEMVGTKLSEDELRFLWIIA
ncbi:zf-RVT domain-containing protein [Cephalotus follicularis]|uniref:Zf-RVT domain-containing protein n=1 Tax=Cephalotus follicularis TaxID=3775 RepID=A0A1Q3BG46_CEPFO|nr:zf-RVT domain-containing protein [Cephalotus follicularis]